MKPKSAQLQSPPTTQPAPSDQQGANWQTRHFDEIDSTNSQAMREAVAGERGPLWITARCQTGGRGRSGRRWLSEPGNLAASFVFTPKCSPASLPQLSLLAGVAIHDVLRTVVDECADPLRDVRAGGSPDAQIRLKWPNDILIGGEKLGGVLIESSRLGADLVAVIGIGLNIASAPDLSDYRTTYLHKHLGLARPSGEDTPALLITPDQLVQRLAGAMDRWLTVWANGSGFDTICRHWQVASLERGSRIAITAGGRPALGAFEGIDSEGALLLRDDDGSVCRYTFGDVAIVPAERS